LDFRIPYLLNGKEHQYIPDFIARIVTPKGEAINLIIEISGFSDDIEGSKDAKRQYVSGYWLPAANNLAKYGRWDFIEIDDIDNIKKILKDKIQQL
jgi:type III restriction enzyme